MKTTSRLVALFALVLATTASAQTVYLQFSGGGGTPLVITWTTPITYTITGTPNPGTKDPYFVFDEIGNIYSGMQFSAPTFITSGAPTYSGVDGTFLINNISSGENWNNITPNDIKFRNVPDAGATFLYVGETFTLSAGTLTTSVNYSGAAPADGLYATFIVDASYGYLGSGVSAVPEPSTYAMLLGVAALGGALWRRRAGAVCA
ncbi:MAG: hypothetical protein C0502_01530 [Opitutus sp.]|nr:hypothetical protein [Opitutus sp.]